MGMGMGIGIRVLLVLWILSSSSSSSSTVLAFNNSLMTSNMKESISVRSISIRRGLPPRQVGPKRRVRSRQLITTLIMMTTGNNNNNKPSSIFAEEETKTETYNDNDNDNDDEHEHRGDHDHYRDWLFDNRKQLVIFYGSLAFLETIFCN